MPDTKTITYELEGKQFQFKVPKGADEETIHKTAEIAYEAKFGPPPQAGQMPVIRPEKVGEGDINVDPVARHNFMSGATPGMQDEEMHGTGGQGMDELAGLGMGVGALRAPIATAKAVGAGIGTAALGLPWWAQLIGSAVAGSPKLAGGLKGAARAIAPTAENITINAGPSRTLARGLGAAAGYGIGRWPGLVAGRDIGETAITPILHPAKLVTGIAKGAIEGAADKPILPQIMRDVSPQVQPNLNTKITSVVPPNEYNAKQIPGRTLVTPPPANQPRISSPAISPGLQSSGQTITPPEPRKLLLDKPPLVTPPPRATTELGSQDFWQRLQQIDPKDVTSPKPKDIKVNPPVEHQVPAATKSVIEELPKNEIKVNPPEKSTPTTKETEKSPAESALEAIKKDREKNTVTSPEKETKPFFSHDLIGKIKEAAGGKDAGITFTDVGRYLEEQGHDVQPTKFGSGKFSGRSVKGETRTLPSETSGKGKIIQGALDKLMKENPELF